MIKTERMGARQSSLTAIVKFTLFSAFGVFAFFINFSLPEYALEIGVWQFGRVEAVSTVLVTHFTNLLRAALWTGGFKAMPAIVWLIGVYGIVDLFVLRFNKFWRTSRVSSAFAAFRCVGFVLLTFTVAQYYFSAFPGFMGWYFTGLDSLGGDSISFFVMNKILVSICISIPSASLFLPFLLDYGLVDFIGVIARPLIRPVFKLPGRAAVIMVSAFLGNFSIGHIAVNDQYKQGRMSERESVIIGTSLSTVSIGFLLVLAQITDIMPYWNAYFWTTFFITLLVAVIGARLFPLSRIPDSYLEGVTPVPETIYRSSALKHAIREGLDVAAAAQHPGKRIAYIMKETVGVLGTTATGSTFFSTAGVLLYTYTAIFKWMGYVFYPFVRIAIPASEALTASTGAAVSFLEVTIPALLVATGQWTLRIRYMLAVIPVTSIIFLASFVPCIMATDVPVKFRHMVVIWFERMVLSIVAAALFALLLFPAGAV